jgi:hypothetical protein
MQGMNGEALTVAAVIRAFAPVDTDVLVAALLDLTMDGTIRLYEGPVSAAPVPLPARAH